MAVAALVALALLCVQPARGQCAAVITLTSAGPLSAQRSPRASRFTAFLLLPARPPPGGAGLTNASSYGISVPSVSETREDVRPGSARPGRAAGRK